MMRSLLLAAVAAASLGAAPAAQVPPPAAAPAPAPAPARDLPSPPDDFTYTPGNRRDPFQALTRRVGTVTQSTDARPAGAAGILVDELSVRGIVLSNGTYVAMVSGPGSGQTYSVRAGSRLFDGTVQSITPRAVVIVQQVNDPLSVQKQREVRKLLRTQEEGK